MRCSLLTLSMYLDGELAPDRSGEVEAHLVACQRCSSGLGYLREEKAHISTLAAVHAESGAAEELLGTVGLTLLPAPVRPAEPAPQFLLDLAESPGPAQLPPPSDGSGSYLELNGSPAPLAEPEAHDTAEPDSLGHAIPETDTGTVSTEPDVDPDDTVSAPLDSVHEAPDDGAHGSPDAERGDEPKLAAAPVAPAPASWSEPYTRDASPPVQPPRPSPAPLDGAAPEEIVPRALIDTAVDATAGAMAPPHPTPPEPAPPMPGPPAVALAGRPSSWLHRARDAVAVRWALMRGPSTADVDDEDDGIQIVSGTGAPDRRPAFTARERLAAQAALRQLEDEGVLAPDEPTSDDAAMESAVTPERESRGPSISFDMQAPIVPPAEVPRPRARDDEPASPGRHQRALHRDGSRRALPSFAMQRPARRTPSRPSGVASPRDDRRLWVFGAAVLVLGLIGLLIGKSVTPASRSLTAGGVPNPTAIARPAAHANGTPAATPRPTPQPTATPVPTPAVANPNQLTGAQNLGAGDSGFTVQDIRYGAHPGDFRMVFDLSGSGSPATTVGFGNPTTLYVIFTGATGPAAVTQPAAGNTATAVKLLQPSPIAGKTVYEVSLSGPATLATSYLQGPVRLVIDLG